jgi:putative nucleotidyltransferase with HDIG domain
MADPMHGSLLLNGWPRRSGASMPMCGSCPSNIGFPRAGSTHPAGTNVSLCLAGKANMLTVPKKLREGKPLTSQTHARSRPIQLAEKTPSMPWVRVAGWAAIAAGGLLALVLVRLTGGSPNPLNHLGYLPIVLAAYLFGWGGGLVTAVYVAFLLGPLPTLASLAGGVETPDAWAIRGATFALVGGVTGYLFDHARAATLGWRSAAVEIAQRQRDGMVALARGAEAKDTDTGDHVVRVQLLAEELARATGVDAERAADIGWSAMLHDVGKLHVPDRILLKPGPLSADEWAIMRRHPVWGAEILAQGDGFEVARRIARWHHENIDGSGYPDGLRGERIPLEARIVRIADAFDAITHQRPYKPARGIEWALDELARCAGTQFDPELARLFIDQVRNDVGLRDRLLAHRAAHGSLDLRTS